MQVDKCQSQHITRHKHKLPRLLHFGLGRHRDSMQLLPRPRSCILVCCYSDSHQLDIHADSHRVVIWSYIWHFASAYMFLHPARKHWTMGEILHICKAFDEQVQIREWPWRWDQITEAMCIEICSGSQLRTVEFSLQLGNNEYVVFQFFSP